MSLAEALHDPRTSPLPETLRGLRHFKVLKLNANTYPKAWRASYECYGEDMQILPFVYSYSRNTMNPALNFSGYVLPGYEPMPPEELILIWPA